MKVTRASGSTVYEIEGRPAWDVWAERTREVALRNGQDPSKLEPGDAYGFTFWDRGKCRDKIAGLRSEGIFTPPSTQGSVHYPGMVGGQNWGSVSVDPVRSYASRIRLTMNTW